MTPDEFIEWLAPHAREATSKWSLPASVLIAQAALESGWGQYVIGKYNFFGRKWGGTGEYIEVPTQEYINGQYVTIVDRFQDYESLEEACNDWCVLIAEERAYREAWQTWSDTFNIDAFVYALASVYATDPEYAKKVLSTIRANNLTKYDNY